MSEANDPWASLADTLGAAPAPESAQPTPPPARPAEPRREEPRRAESRRPTPAATGGDWTDIVSGLGLEPDATPPAAPRLPAAPLHPAQSRPAQAPPDQARAPLPKAEIHPQGAGQSPAQPPRGDRDEQAVRGGPPRRDDAMNGARDFLDRPVSERPSADREPRQSDRSRGEEGSAERQDGRGRRGDRRRRDDDRPPRERPRSGEDTPSIEGDLPRRVEGRSDGRRGDQPRREPPRGVGRLPEERSPESGERAFDERRDDSSGDDLQGRSNDGAPVDGDRGDGEPRRGRRRRGRRGGRGRGGRDRAERSPRSGPDSDGVLPADADHPEPRDDRSEGEFAAGGEGTSAPLPERQGRGSRRPPHGEGSRDRGGARREPAGREAPRAERPGRDVAPERAGDDAAGFDWEAPIDAERPIPTRGAPPRAGDDESWGGIDLEPRSPGADGEGGDDAPRGDDSGDDQSGRRRRRRGRRGGRRRGGRERTGEDRVGADREGPAGDAPRQESGDDEPLPAGYGRAAAPPGPGEGARGGEGGKSADGESRGRRRRGRGGRRDDAARPAKNGSEAGGEAAGRGRSSPKRGRDGRRPPETQELRPTSSFSRGRREDFAPVAGGYDEDDEGLEYLIDEAGRDQPPQREPRRAEDDKDLVESGWSDVTDVPSWVEAIGIVIAGNLDARNKPPRADDHDRGRRDQNRGRS